MDHYYGKTTCNSCVFFVFVFKNRKKSMGMELEGSLEKYKFDKHYLKNFWLNYKDKRARYATLNTSEYMPCS